MRPLSYGQTDVFISCFSVVSPSSFANTKSKWHQELTHHCPGVPVVLVGTKTDLRNDPDTLERLKGKRQEPISREEGEKACKELGYFRYVECSALKLENVKEAVETAIRAVLVNRDSISVDQLTYKPQKQRCIIN